jgi:hypothetical protein
MVFGQLLAERAFSLPLAFGGAGVWMVLVAYSLALVRGETIMTNIFILLGGTLLFATVIVVLDEIGRRRRRRSGRS